MFIVYGYIRPPLLAFNKKRNILFHFVVWVGAVCTGSSSKLDDLSCHGWQRLYDTMVIVIHCVMPSRSPRGAYFVTFAI